VLVRHHFLSLDPYMRGRMNDAKSYAAPQPLGQVMQGGTVGEVVESRTRSTVGDKVVGFGGWQQYSVVAADQPGALRKVDTTHVPLSHYLGAVGMPGVTAWYGLVKIIEPKAGQTRRGQRRQRCGGQRVRCAGQGARLPRGRHCRRPRQVPLRDRRARLRRLHRLQAAPRRQVDVAALKEACPDGIDGYFENVGGMVMDAVLLRMNAFARVALCGMIAGYDGAPMPMNNPAAAPDQPPEDRRLHRQRAHGSVARGAGRTGRAGGTGKLKPRESVAQGMEAAPEAFLGLLKGKNFGKQLVKLI
jgi:NADPH-dependent curcumin reductase CurA